MLVEFVKSARLVLEILFSPLAEILAQADCVSRPLRIINVREYIIINSKTKTQNRWKDDVGKGENE